ncbi:hypothetical protein NMC42_11730 [Pseudomonas aeruginosa]
MAMAIMPATLLDGGAGRLPRPGPLEQQHEGQQAEAERQAEQRPGAADAQAEAAEAPGVQRVAGADPGGEGEEGQRQQPLVEPEGLRQARRQALFQQVDAHVPAFHPYRAERQHYCADDEVAGQFVHPDRRAAEQVAGEHAVDEQDQVEQQQQRGEVQQRGAHALEQ